MNNRNEAPTPSLTPEAADIAAALATIQPRTPLGTQLIELSLLGLEQGVEPLSADEILEYLGREPYEDIH